MRGKRTRILLLGVLAAVGITLAGVGVALGIGNSNTDDDRIAEVSVARTNLTVSDGGNDVVLMENVSETSDIEIVKNRTEITVTEHESDPLTQRERERAIEIARNNETVASHLETVDDPDFTVDPVERIDAEEMRTTTVEFDVDELNHTGDSVLVGNVTVEESDDSVTVEREPSHVADRAVVRISPADSEEAQYSVGVDLTNRTVTHVTDWGNV
ncbi:hypothetical protein [Natronomonas marina]|uniref:hypothetical protein n=1 Tax=Natronomonas marina TaxID=2961939 RepID=UPI0020C9BA6A|nr:hypothetical protein [Natronomonas marina]